jgi:hypothetical protein
LNASLLQLHGPKTLADSRIWLLNLKFTNNPMNQQGEVVAEVVGQFDVEAALRRHLAR